MRDPGLVAGDFVDVAVALGARAQRAEIGAGVRFGEYRCRQFLAAGDQRQPVLALVLRAAAQDQFGRDFRSRAERTDADIAAAQFLGHDAHRGLRKSRAAEFFRNGQPENAQRTHLGNHIERDEFVFQMPLMGVGRDLVLREAEELLANHAPSCRRGRDRRMHIAPGCCADDIGDAGADFARVPRCDQFADAWASEIPPHRRRRARDRRDARSRSGSWGCRRRSAPDIRRTPPPESAARSCRGASRARARAPSAPSGEALRHKSRTRRAHAPRAVRGRALAGTDAAVSAQLVAQTRLCIDKQAFGSERRPLRNDQEDGERESRMACPVVVQA